MSNREKFLTDRYKILSSQDSEEFLFLKFPSIHIPKIDSKDFENGFISRFFLKKVNDKPILEINNNQFDLFFSSSFYKKISINWKITGPRNNVIKKSRVEIEGVEDHNLKEIQTAELSLQGMKQKLTNPLQFWKGSN